MAHYCYGQHLVHVAMAYIVVAPLKSYGQHLVQVVVALYSYGSLSLWPTSHSGGYGRHICGPLYSYGRHLVQVDVAFIVVAYVGMAYVVMVCIVMACIVMAAQLIRTYYIGHTIVTIDQHTIHNYSMARIL